jgi:aminopeptidase N
MDLVVTIGRIARLAFAQHDPVPRRELVWSQRIDVALGYDGEIRHLAVRLHAAHVDVSAARGLPAPRFVLPTGQGVAYGGFALDAGSREYLIRHLPEIPDALTRGSATVTLWEEMLDGRADAADVVDTLVRSLPRERDELNLQRMLSYTQQGYWRFLPDAARDALTPRLERVLREGLENAATASQKAAWVSTLRDTARTPGTLAWLERVWRRAEAVPGLELSEPDFIALAMALAVRDVPASQDIIDRQLAQTKNPDRKARFAFVRPALSADEKVRDAFFDALGDEQNRRREPWVLEALSFLHHPLRAERSLKYIPRSLSMLQEIQRSGDIFFPKRWMNATLWGHNSAEAAEMVRTYLAALPSGYPDRLHRVILSSADGLFRATRVREQQ